MQTLNSDHFYWTWRSYEAAAEGDHTLAHEYGRYAAAARELGDREVENLITLEGLDFTVPTPVRIAGASGRN